MVWSGLKKSLQREGLIHDGSFEHQMIWGDPYIPSVMEWAGYGYGSDSNNNFTSWQKIWFEQTTGSPLPGQSNHWVQTEPSGGDRWTISGDFFYPSEPGYQGQYAAKFVFGSEPNSPWLIPFYPEFNPWFAEESWDEEKVLKLIWTMTHEGNGPDWFGLPDGGYVPIVNPKLRTESLVLHAWSDGPCEIEVYFRVWADDEIEGLEFDNVTFSTEMHADSKVHTLAPNVWTECLSTFSLPFRVWPNYPSGNEAWQEVYFIVFWVRAKGGVPGQVVYLDNGFAWPDLTTAGGLLTVGVSEWVRDEKGMYIGAYLWFKTSGGG